MDFRFIPLIFSVALSVNSAVAAEDCHFKYWEVIESNTGCKVYNLPDFSFRKVPASPENHQHVKKFCSRYKVISKFGEQVTSYCYTGEGDFMGPTFRLGDEKWSFSSKSKDRVYFADLNFQGCHQGAETKGIVFGLYGWSKAPTRIERSWPIRKKLAKCER
jgi:hypothetical protein